MEIISTTFSIKDLENLSGIKAHTIRIWEKRYKLLEPERTDTNIRSYSLKSFQKLLNITQLYNNGLKISKIAQLSEFEIREKCDELTDNESVKHSALNDFKIAMFTFDKMLFHTTFDKLLENDSFKNVFINYCIPFLDEIGRLWQTDFLIPAHEHFITSLIRDKIILQTHEERLENENRNKTTFALFLPENEIHELGLIFANFLIENQGFNTIYLGQNIPQSDLLQLDKQFQEIIFVTYFTVEPRDEKLEKYMENIYNDVLLKNNRELWILGRKYALTNSNVKDKNIIKIIKDIEDFTKRLNHINEDINE